jgi:hypothetical protein
MGDQKFIISSSSVLGKVREAVGPAVFAVVSTLCVIHKEGLCPSSGDINRLMMIMTPLSGIRIRRRRRIK